MKSLFERGPSLLTRLVLALLCAAMLMFLDHRLNTMQPVRSFLSTLVTPVQHLAVLPEQTLDRTVYFSTTRSMLREQNEALGHDLQYLPIEVQCVYFSDHTN